MARRVARLCKQPHEVIQVGDEFLARFSHYAERPCTLPTDAAAWTVPPTCTSTNGPRDRSGEDDGELWRRGTPPGAGIQADGAHAGLFRPEFLSHISAAKATYTEVLRGHPLSFAVFRQAPWHHYGLLALRGNSAFPAVSLS